NAPFPTAVAAYADGSVVVVGGFAGGGLSGETTFGVNSGTTTSVTAQGFFDAFVARYDARGGLEWVQTAGDVGSTTEPLGVVALADGSVLVAGFAEGNATFGRGQA